MITVRRGWLALAAAVGTLALVPAGAAAKECERDLGGAARSTWFIEPGDAGFDEGELLDEQEAAMREDAFDGYGPIVVDGTTYDNPDEGGCSLESGGQEVIFPNQDQGDLKVQPQLFVSSKGPFGRQLVRLKNTGDTTLFVELTFEADLGSNGLTRYDRSSNDPRDTVDADDKWATSCEDTEADGCDQQDERFRDPELAHNWERQGGDHDSADDVAAQNGSDNLEVTFSDIKIKPGKTVVYMRVVSLARTIDSANRRAADYGRNPEDHGLFAGLSKNERSLIRNW